MQRIQRKRSKGWRMPANTVVVDRTSGFGNPFPVAKGTSRSMGKESDVWFVGIWSGPAMWIRDSKDEAVELSVKAYSAWIKHPAQAKLVERAKVTLRGKNLACWCAPDKPCHADVLLELANA
jgi:hypothetical protein